MRWSQSDDAESNGDDAAMHGRDVFVSAFESGTQ